MILVLETLFSSVINKAGGLTDQAYPEASVFTRLAVCRTAKKLLICKNADNLEKISYRFNFFWKHD